MWTIQGACDRVFMINRQNGDLWEILDGRMQQVVAGSAARPAEQEDPASVLLTGLDRFPTWSGKANDRDLFVGQDVVEIGGVTYVGQVQPTTPDAQPDDEIAKAGPCELIILDFDTKKELLKAQFETRVEAWAEFDTFIQDGLALGMCKPVLQLDHASSEAQA